MTELNINPDVPPLLEHLDRHLAFQRKWRRITMCLYVAFTATVILCSTGATIVSALNGDIYASILAGIATVLVGLDKSLLLREKWKLHVSVAMNLENTRLDLVV